jgi:hypothetical protein
VERLPESLKRFEVPRRIQGEEDVEKAPSFRRRATDEPKVIGSEENGSDLPDRIAEPGDDFAVDEDPLLPRRGPIGGGDGSGALGCGEVEAAPRVCERVTFLACELGGDPEVILSESDELFVPRVSKGSKSLEVVHRLEEIRLSLCISTDQRHPCGGNLERDVPQIPVACQGDPEESGHLGYLFEAERSQGTIGL